MNTLWNLRDRRKRGLDHSAVPWRWPSKTLPQDFLLDSDRRCSILEPHEIVDMLQLQRHELVRHVVGSRCNLARLLRVFALR